MNPTASSPDQSLYWSAYHFFNDNERARFMDKLPTYQARAADFDNEFDPLEW